LTYDEEDNLTVQADGEGRATYFKYDRLDRQIKIRDGIYTYFTFDKAGRREEGRMPNAVARCVLPVQELPTAMRFSRAHESGHWREFRIAVCGIA
jgi:YD repeat-containing protein